MSTRLCLAVASLAFAACSSSASNAAVTDDAAIDASTHDATTSNDAPSHDAPSNEGAPTDATASDLGVVLGDPGCGLPAAAFCETFDAPAKNRGRAGELDVARWSAGRMAPQGPTAGGQAFGVTVATLQPTRTVSGVATKLPACRSGLAAQVFPDSDFLVCDPSDDVHSNHLMVATASQNYGENSLRIRQPFDFAGRTGTIVFDAEGFNAGLLGWVSLDVTEDPIAVPSFQTLLNDEGAVLPRNGFSVQLSGSCSSTTPVVGVSELHVFDKYAETILKAPNDGSALCVDAQWGKLNHFEIDVSASKIDVYGTPFSNDGVSYGAKVLLFSAPVTLPFTRGYVQLVTHNHATLKYSAASSGFADGFLDLDAWIARWDEVGFDGPIVSNAREYEAADPLFAHDVSFNGSTNHVVDTGYTIPDASSGSTAKVTFHGVDLAGAKKAQIAATVWYCLPCASPPEQFDVKYRLNGHAWHDRPLSAGELADAKGGKAQGAFGEMFDAPLDELVAGDNLFELQTVNVPQNYPPGVVNVDLVVTPE